MFKKQILEGLVCPKCGSQECYTRVDPERFQPVAKCDCGWFETFEILEEREELRKMHEIDSVEQFRKIENATRSADITTGGLTGAKIQNAIEDPTIRELLELVDVTALQNHLELAIGAYGPALESMDGPEAHREALDLAYAKTCLDVEFGELLQKLPWKKWKTAKYDKVTDAEIAEQMGGKEGGEIAMEAADTVFFATLALIHAYRILGLQATDATTKLIYALKWCENFERVKTGSFNGDVDKKFQKPPVEAITAAMAVAGIVNGKDAR